MTLPRISAPANPFGWRFVAPLLWGSALNPINSSIIATALVGIGADLHVGVGATASLVSVLYLASAVAQPTMGKLSRRFGARRIFIIGMGIVAIGGLLGGFGPTLGWLLASRLLIGIGTSAGYPTAMALIRGRAEETGSGVPGGVLGALSIAGVVTAALGLPLGGALVGLAGWRSVFLLNVPVAIVGIIATLVWVPRDRPDPTASQQSWWRSIDPVGILLFAATTTALLLFLTDLRTPRWWLLVLDVVLAAALIVWERRNADPFIDVRALGANAPLQRTYIRNFVTLLASYCVFYGLSQWMEESRHLSPTAVGLILLPLTGVGAILSAVVSRRNLVRGPLIITAATIIAAGVALLFVTSQSSIVVLLAVSVLFGISGIGTIGNQAALYKQSPSNEIAVASGLLRTSGYIGAIFSASVIALAFGQSATDGGLRLIAYAFAGMGVLILILTITDRTIPRTAD